MDLPKHGSPQDRGSADAYYSRRFDPHWWPEGTGSQRLRTIKGAELIEKFNVKECVL